MSDSINKLVEVANQREDGHLTIFKWTTGWKAMLGTPDLDLGRGRWEIWRLPIFQTLDEACDWAAGTIPLNLGHPYLKHGGGSVMRSFNTKFRVKWRDFQSIKQDLDFDTVEEAELFAMTLPKTYVDATDLEQLECYGETYEGMTKYWGSF